MLLVYYEVKRGKDELCKWVENHKKISNLNIISVKNKRRK